MGQIRLGPPKGSAEGSTKVPPRFRQSSSKQGSTKVPQVSCCLWFCGADPSWTAKRFRRRFDQGFAKVPASKVPPRFLKFVLSLVLWGRSVLDRQKVPQKVPPRFRQSSSKQGSTKVPQVSCCLWFCGADPSWTAKRFRRRFHQGFAKVPASKVPPRFLKFRAVSGSVGQIRLGPPKGSAEGSTKVPPKFRQARFHQGSSSFVLSLVLWGRSVLDRQKVPQKVPPRFRQSSSKQGSTKVPQVSCCLWFCGADPSWTAKRFRRRFDQGSAKVPASKVPPRFLKFRAVSGSVGQIRLGPPKGSAEGSTKVPPKFQQARFHQRSSSHESCLRQLASIFCIGWGSSPND